MKKLKDMRLYCMICRKEIDDKRSTNGNIVTCSRECSVALNRRRLAWRNLVRCVRCDRPASPEEIKEFKAWRKERGDHKKRGPKPRGIKPSDQRQMVMANDLTIN